MIIQCSNLKLYNRTNNFHCKPILYHIQIITLTDIICKMNFNLTDMFLFNQILYIQKNLSLDSCDYVQAIFPLLCVIATLPIRIEQSYYHYTIKDPITATVLFTLENKFVKFQVLNEYLLGETSVSNDM